ncbi:MAG: hypothetical protein GXP31_19565 [Kiritimatiellaeota bacterium]|nr:hypothetical protein [Kiritimatiellota bacterium]
MRRPTPVLLCIALSTGAWSQAAPKVYESAGVRVEDGPLIRIASDRYEALVSRKTGTVMEMTSRGEPLFTNIHPFIMMHRGQGGRRRIRIGKASFRKLPAGVAIDLRGYSTGGARAMRCEINVEALAGGVFTVRTTLTPQVAEKARFIFLQTTIPDRFAGATVDVDGEKQITLPAPRPEKYRNLAQPGKYLAIAAPDDLLTAPLRVEFPDGNRVQLGSFRDKYDIQFKDPIVTGGVLEPDTPLRFGVRFRIPARKPVPEPQAVLVALEPGRFVRKLHKGLFSEGAYRFGGAGAKLFNDFVNNHKQVALMQECGIPALRFNCLYTILGIPDGWTRKVPYEVDPVYPKDGGPISTAFADAQMRAIREKLGCDLYLCMSFYRPSWMRFEPGKAIYFQPVRGATDLAAYARFAEKLARHAKQSRWNVKIWEVWNEPNADNQWRDGTWSEYIDFYRAVAPAIRRGDPEAKIAGPVFAGFDEALLEQFLTGIEDLPCDYLDWHHYGNLDGIVPRIEIVKKVLARHGRRETGLFISELGTGNGRPGSTVAAGIFLARAWQRVLYHGVDFCTHWNLVGPTGGRGMINSDDWTPTPVYYLFKMFNRIARLPESDLLSPPSLPKGLECIAAKGPDGYSFFFIKTDAFRRIKLTLDLAAFPGMVPQLYSFKRGLNAEPLAGLGPRKDRTLTYEFEDREVLLLKLLPKP